MSLRHAMLGLLSVEPATGYDLTLKFEASLRHAWHASHSQIYPELARLQQLGMVEEVGQGPRGSRTWAITEQGRAELRRWLVEAQPNRAQRNETTLRWFLLPLVTDEDRRSAIMREIENIEKTILMLESISTSIRTESEPGPFEPTVDLGLRLNQVMLGWLQDQLPDGQLPAGQAR